MHAENKWKWKITERWRSFCRGAYKGHNAVSFTNKGIFAHTDAFARSGYTIPRCLRMMLPEMAVWPLLFFQTQTRPFFVVVLSDFSWGFNVWHSVCLFRGPELKLPNFSDHFCMRPGIYDGFRCGSVAYGLEKVNEFVQIKFMFLCVCRVCHLGITITIFAQVATMVSRLWMPLGTYALIRLDVGDLFWLGVCLPRNGSVYNGRKSN